MTGAAHLRGPLGWSIAALLLGGTYLGVGVLAALSPLLDGAEATDVDAQSSRYVDRHHEMVAVDIARFTGRSAFFKPLRRPAPPPPRAPNPPRDPDPDPEPGPDPGPPPPPRTYMGPQLIAIIGNEAWFRGSGRGFDSVIRLGAGEEHNGLVLVSTAAPSRATVQYSRGEYEIDLFSYEEPFLLQEAHPTAEPGFLETVPDDESVETP